MRLRYLVSSLAALACLVAQPAAAAVEPVEADRIVAVVGSDVITYSELKRRLQSALAQLRRQGTPLPPESVLEQQMLERLITDRVQLIYARDNGLRIDDVLVDQAIGRIAANNKLSLADFRQVLVRDGVSYPRFREEIRDEMTMGRLREREVDSRIVISAAEIDAYLKEQANVSSAGEFELAHILLRAPESASPEQIQKLRAKAEGILARARAGEDFAALSASFSDAPEALKGGSIGWRTLDRLPTLYSDAVSKLAAGGVSDVLRSSAGFHILKLVGQRGGAAAESIRQTRARHILIRANELMSENEVRRKLEAVRERLQNGADFAELARLYSQDGTAAKGGDLGWLNPGDTVPEFEQAMNALKEGEVSGLVQSPFGLHLIQVQERRQRDVSEERLRSQARQHLRERRLDDAYQDWLRQLRDRTYIENRLEER